MDKLKELLAALEAREAEFKTMVQEYGVSTEGEGEGDTQRAQWTPEQVDAAEKKRKEVDDARKAYEEEKARIDEAQQRAENTRKEAEEWLVNIQKRSKEREGADDFQSADAAKRHQQDDSKKYGSIEDMIHWMRNDGVLPNGTERSFFDLVLPYKDDITGKWETEEQAFQRAISTTSGAAMVSGPVAERLVMAMYDNDPVRDAGATVVRRPTGVGYKISTIARPTGNVPTVAEGGTSQDRDPLQGGVTITPVRKRARIEVTDEMLEDNGVGLLTQLPRYMRDDVFAAFGQTHTQQMLTAAAVTGNFFDIRTSGSGHTFNDIDLEAMQMLYAGVEKPYRRSARLMVNTRAALQIGAIQTGSANASPLAYPLTYDAQGMIVSAGPFRLIINDEMPDTPAANTIAAIYCDFSAFNIVDVRGIRIQRDDYSSGDSGEVLYRFGMRSGSAFVSPAKPGTNQGNFGIYALRW